MNHLKGLNLNVPKSHNVSFEQMRFKVFKTLANQSNDGKNLNGVFITFVMYLYLFQQLFRDLI